MPRIRGGGGFGKAGLQAGLAIRIPRLRKTKNRHVFWRVTNQTKNRDGDGGGFFRAKQRGIQRGVPKNEIPVNKLYSCLFGHHVTQPSFGWGWSHVLRGGPIRDPRSAIRDLPCPVRASRNEGPRLLHHTGQSRAVLEAVPRLQHLEGTNRFAERSISLSLSLSLSLSASLCLFGLGQNQRRITQRTIKRIP